MNVKSGETVLIHGAGGMVGYAAVQLALRRGARVIATVGPTFASDLEGFGAIVTPYGEGMVERVQSLADGPVDHVLDASRPNAGAIAALIEIAGDPTAGRRSEIFTAAVSPTGLRSRAHATGGMASGRQQMPLWVGARNEQLPCAAVLVEESGVDADVLLNSLTHVNA
jgi:NAD(P)-dependent dehydrogenase (short-subunit alcohol dehydrogenase family)